MLSSWLIFCDEYSSLCRFGTVLCGEQLSVFHRLVVPSSSGVEGWWNVTLQKA